MNDHDPSLESIWGNYLEKIEILNFEIHPKGLFTHQKSNKRAKNLQGTLNFHRKRELIEL